MAWNFGKKSVFPAQREDDDETVKVSREAWDQMQRALGGMTEKLNKLERKSNRPVVVQAAEPAHTKITPHEPKVDMAGLPDPVTDRDGFLAGVSKRLQTQLDTMSATIKGQQEDDAKSARAASAASARVNKLWEKWQKSHKQFAKFTKVVEAEARAMVQEGLAQGMDLDAVMFADEDGFMDDLAERVGKSLEDMGVKLPAEDARDPNEVASDVDAGLAQFADQFKGKDDDDSRQRARDLPAGDAGSLTPRKKGSAAEDKPMPLTDQLKQAQEHMGIA